MLTIALIYGILFISKVIKKEKKKKEKKEEKGGKKRCQKYKLIYQKMYMKN